MGMKAGGTFPQGTPTGLAVTAHGEAERVYGSKGSFPARGRGTAGDNAHRGFRRAVARLQTSTRRADCAAMAGV